MNVFEDLIEELKGENLLEGTIFDELHSLPENGESEVALAANGSVLTRDLADLQAKGPQAGQKFEVREGDSDFYRKRAMQEVSSLQMVEHVLSGVEREHLKAVPSTYDDLKAKKALHILLQAADDINSEEYARAAHALMEETGVWSTALFARDSRISVSNIRRFCENSRPALSSQALMSLARFYRNSPYSEAIRSKFDFVMTRLFARETDYQKRKLLFERAEMIGHIETLYANWSSLSYSSELSEAEQKLIVASFHARMKEADQAKAFEELVKDDFFKKIHELKESLNETFFVPAVAAAAIECNVRIGNKFVELVQKERGILKAETIEEKYGYTYDHIISNAAGRTLHLVELLKNEDGDTEAQEVGETGTMTEVQVVKKAAHAYERAPVAQEKGLFAVNKWLFLLALVAILAGGASYFWASGSEVEETSVTKAKPINLNNTELNNYLEKGRATKTTFYAVTRPTWDELPEEQRREVLQKALEFGRSNGLDQVQLMNDKGRNVAFATPNGTEISYQPEN